MAGRSSVPGRRERPSIPREARRRPSGLNARHPTPTGMTRRRPARCGRTPGGRSRVPELHRARPRPPEARSCRRGERHGWLCRSRRALSSESAATDRAGEVVLFRTLMAASTDPRRELAAKARAPGIVVIGPIPLDERLHAGAEAASWAASRSVVGTSPVEFQGPASGCPPPSRGGPGDAVEVRLTPLAPGPARYPVLTPPPAAITRTNH